MQFKRCELCLNSVKALSLLILTLPMFLKSSQLLYYLSSYDVESGCVYKRALVDNEDDYFQDYHITAADDASSTAVPFLPSDCRPKQLPPTYYVMAVDSDIYRRMFDEVAESVNMPCKLFYCGHHEDVDYPSIGIAVTGVVTILSVMLLATIYVGA